MRLIFLVLKHHLNFVLGPTKLFVLVRASSSFNLPLHFLPKRDFRYSKKVKKRSYTVPALCLICLFCIRRLFLGISLAGEEEHVTYIDFRWDVC